MCRVVVLEEKAAGHAGNPDAVPDVEDHNYGSIGIEMYQLDISMFECDKSKLDSIARSTMCHG